MLAALATVAAASAAAAPRLFLSCERPFLPDEPGAIVKLELTGAGPVDVRLYRVPDPERALASLRPGAAGPDIGPPPARRHSATHALAETFAGVGDDIARSARASLSPTGRSLVRALLPDDRLALPPSAPFLRGWELVERWRLPCGGGGAASEVAYCDLDIGPRAAGTYRVEAVAGTDVASTLTVVSKLGLLARSAADRVVLLAVDARTGAPMPGAQIQLLADGAVVARGAAGRDGTYAVRFAGRELRAIARAGPDVALVDVDRPRAHAPDRRILVLTDRAEYAPGQVVRYKVVGRAAGGEPLAGEVAVTLEDARGSVVATDTRELSPTGAASGLLAIADGLADGAFRLLAAHPLPAGPRAEGSADLWVRRSPEPEVEVAVRIETGSDRSLTAAVFASARGRPLPAARCAHRVLVADLTAQEEEAFEERDRGEGEAGPDGRLLIPVRPSADRDARVAIAVECRDALGRAAESRAETTVLAAPVRVVLAADRRLYAPGGTVVVSIRTEGADGSPRPARVQLRVLAARGGPAAETPRAPVRSEAVDTGADGRGELRFAAERGGYYEIEASAGGVRAAETFVYVTAEGGDIPFTPEEMTLVPDRVLYGPGDAARVLVLAPFEAGTVLATIETPDAVRHEVLAIRGSSAVLTVRVTAASAPSFVVSAQGMFGGQTYRRERAVRVAASPPLEVRLRAEPPAAAPGDEVTLRIEVLDRGRPAPRAEVLLVVLDAEERFGPAPPAHVFFHPDRRLPGAFAASTALRLSTYARTARRALAEDDALLLFKASGLDRPRPATAGTVLFAPALVADARGRAAVRVRTPASGRALKVRAVASIGATFGEATLLVPATPGVALAIDVPAFARAGDVVVARARLQNLGAGSASAQLFLSGAAPASARSIELPGGAVVELPAPVTVGGREVEIAARLQPGPSASRTVRSAPARALTSRVRSGVAMPGARVSVAFEAPDGATVAIVAAAGAGALARRVRAALGDQPTLLVDRATARVFARAAEGLAGGTETPDWLRGARLDVARLVALARPEGHFGAFDGAPPDAARTAQALAALELLRRLGVAADEGLRGRAALRVAEDAKSAADPASAWALALTGREPGVSAGLVAREAEGSLGVADRAFVSLALSAVGRAEQAARVAARLERLGRGGPAGTCFADAACDVAALTPAQAATTALSAWALAVARPKSTRLGAALRALAAAAGDGGFGSPAAAGFAALAFTAWPAAPEARLVVRGPRGRAVELDLAAGPGGAEGLSKELLLLAHGGPVAFLARIEEEPAATASPVVRRVYRRSAPGDGVAGPLRVGDEVRVEIDVAGVPPGPIEIRDELPAGLAPILHPGAADPLAPLRAAGGLARPTGTGMAFALAAPKGAARIAYLARAAFAGRFAAPPAVVDAPAARGWSAPQTVAVEPSP